MKKPRWELFLLGSVLLLVFVIALLVLPDRESASEQINIAVASNFTDAIKAIVRHFEADTGYKVILVFGSTGKHYAQIKNGAPFDAFFAADVERPKLLEQEGLALPDSRFTYAVGKVVLWSPKLNVVDSEGNILNTSNFRYLALANPKLAPYGKAAEQILRKRGLWDSLQGRMIFGENIVQTFQFVKSGNAELGFEAYSQIKNANNSTKGSFWDVPQSFYDPIRQQAVLLKDNDVARKFLSFVKSDKGQKIIQKFGYGTP